MQTKTYFVNFQGETIYEGLTKKEAINEAERLLKGDNHHQIHIGYKCELIQDGNRIELDYSLLPFFVFIISNLD
jgi:hypothetical protein